MESHDSYQTIKMYQTLIHQSFENTYDTSSSLFSAAVGKFEQIGKFSLKYKTKQKKETEK